MFQIPIHITLKSFIRILWQNRTKADITSTSKKYSHQIESCWACCHLSTSWVFHPPLKSVYFYLPIYSASHSLYCCRSLVILPGRSNLHTQSFHVWEELCIPMQRQTRNIRLWLEYGWKVYFIPLMLLIWRAFIGTCHPDIFEDWGEHAVKLNILSPMQTLIYTPTCTPSPTRLNIIESFSTTTAIWRIHFRINYYFTSIITFARMCAVPLY